MDNISKLRQRMEANRKLEQGIVEQDSKKAQALEESKNRLKAMNISYQEETQDDLYQQIEELEAKINAQLELLQREGELPASHTNLFCEYKNNEWVVTIFPRITHRPRQFFSEGEDRLMMSPGAIDMTGHLIAARQEDFEKITKEILFLFLYIITKNIGYRKSFFCSV